MEKQLLIRPVKNLATMLEIHYEGGGEVPAVLSGMYTSRSVAQSEIDRYLASREKKSNGKGTSNR